MCYDHTSIMNSTKPCLDVTVLKHLHYMMFFIGMALIQNIQRETLYISDDIQIALVSFLIYHSSKLFGPHWFDWIFNPTKAFNVTVILSFWL